MRTVRVSGSLASHYAPATPLELFGAELLWQRARELEAVGARVGVVTWSSQDLSQRRGRENKNLIHFSMPAEPVSYGRLLYASLRQWDHEGFDHLLVELPPTTRPGRRLRDRLRRASSNDSSLWKYRK